MCKQRYSRICQAQLEEAAIETDHGTPPSRGTALPRTGPTASTYYLGFSSLPFDRSALQSNTTTLGVFLLHLFLISSLGAAALLGCQFSAK